MRKLEDCDNGGRAQIIVINGSLKSSCRQRDVMLVYFDCKCNFYKTATEKTQCTPI